MKYFVRQKTKQGWTTSQCRSFYSALKGYNHSLGIGFEIWIEFATHSVKVSP